MNASKICEEICKASARYFLPNMEKHKPYASIDYEDLEYGIFFENSEDEDDK